MWTRRTRCWALHRLTPIDRAMNAASLCLLALSIHGTASAAPARIAVIHDARQEHAALRLRAEANAAGFEAVDVVVPPPDPRSTAKITFSIHAVAALRMLASGDLELLIIDSGTGELIHRAVLSETGDGA